MPNYITTPLRSKTGIQRDCTVYDSDNYVDGEWCRFYNGAPRKMGGYSALTAGTSEVVRNMFSVPISSAIDIYLGRPSSLSYIEVTFSGQTSAPVVRTPTSGFVANPDNQWCFDMFIDSSTVVPTSYIVGHVAPNVLDITSTTEGAIFYGNINVDTPLTQVVDTNNANAPVLCSGGIIYSSPVLVAYGNDGIIKWCAPNDLTTWSTGAGPVLPYQQAIANTKIIKGYRNRGGATPSLLFWTATSLVSATYELISGVISFGSQTLSDDITVMSPNCIVKYNQMFYWIGIDQFYMFNGITQKMPNTMSTDWFFDNLNYEYRSKVFGFAVPRYGEIWWHYPRRVAGLPDDEQPTECTHVVIFNIVENTWYDTPLARTAGIPSTAFPYPVMADAEIVTSGGVGTYPIWQHEIGEDKVIGGYNYPIRSSFQTSYIDLFSQNATNNVLMRVRRIEPDFILRGAMDVEIKTRSFPQSQDAVTGPFTLDGTTRKVDDVDCQGRLVSAKFTSNTLGGYYQAGHILLDYNEGDKVP